MKRFATAVGILLVVMLVLIVGVVVVGAQEDEPATPDTPSEEPAPGRFGKGPGRLQGYIDHDAMQAAMADALGLTVEELETARAEGKRLSEIAEEQGVDLADVEAAVRAVFEDAVQQAVVDGVLTQEEADMLLDHAGLGRFKFGRPGRGGYGPLADYIDSAAIKAATADALGLTVEELDAARAEGKRLPEIAEEQGVDLADVQAATRAVFEDAVQQALEAGVITEEEAARILEGGPCGGAGFGHHGRGGFGPRGGGPGRFGSHGGQGRFGPFNGQGNFNPFNNAPADA